MTMSKAIAAFQLLSLYSNVQFCNYYSALSPSENLVHQLDDLVSTLVNCSGIKYVSLDYFRQESAAAAADLAKKRQETLLLDLSCTFPLATACPLISRGLT